MNWVWIILGIIAAIAIGIAIFEKRRGRRLQIDLDGSTPESIHKTNEEIRIRDEIQNRISFF
jgi:hypothetical protein